MKKLTLVLALASLFLLTPVAAQDLEVALQRAIQKETAGGDLKAAIAEYRGIAERAGANRGLAARALLRMADAHRKLGEAEALAIYQRVIKEYGDQTAAVAEARRRLAVGSAANPVPSGQAVRQLWTGEGVDPMGAPSADGRILSFTDWSTGDLAVRDLAAGTNRRLTSTGGWEKSGDFAEFSVPSPDGREVAYAWFSDKLVSTAPYDLRIISTAAEGAKPRVVLRSDDLRWVAPWAWTPDGRSLVVMRELQAPRRGVELAVIAVATGAVRTVKPLGVAAQRVSLSPDGRWIAYDRPAAAGSTSRDVFVIGIDGSGDTAIAATTAHEQLPLWSPDGSEILFISNRTGSNAIWSAGVRDGRPLGEPRLVKADANSIYPLGITRNGGLYYFQGGDRQNFYMSELGAGLKATGGSSLVAENFLNSNASGAWSPDGQSIAYFSFRGLRDSQGTTLVIRDVKSGRERDIPLSATVQRSGAGLRWFDGGRAILIPARDADGTSYYRVDVTSGAETLLFKMAGTGPGANNPAISPDGRTLFHVDPDERGGTRSLTRVDLDTKKVTVVLKGWIHALAMAPDGRHLAYLGARETINSRTAEVGIVPVEGGEPRVLYTATWIDSTRHNALAWTPDGKEILFVRPDDPAGTESLWHVPAAGGAAQKVGISVRGRLKNPSVHPDGRRILFSVRDFTDAAVWVLENFLSPSAQASGDKSVR